MTLIQANRVQETSTSTGTGAFTLLGAIAADYQTFLAAVGNGNTCRYEINLPGSQWETGIGTISTTGPTLTRTTPLTGSAGANTAVNFSAGTKNVTLSINAEGVLDASLAAPLASPTFTGTVTVPTTVNATDAAQKAYVDAVAQGLAVKGSCALATAAALPTNTYNNGASGVGATLTGVATGTLTVDGVLTTLGMRILVQNEVAGANNGLYLVTTAGAGGVAYVLTRTTDANTSADLVGAFTFIEQGTANVNAGFVCTNSSTITIGTTAITFTQFSGAGEITAGAGISKSGNTLSAHVDGTTIDTGAAGNALEIVAGGVGTTQLAANAVTNAKMATMAATTVKMNATGGSAVPTDATASTFKTAFSINTSAAFAFASASGAALNSNLTSGGGTDDTTVIQAALTALGALGGGTFIQDGVSLVSQLKIPSNVTIDGMSLGNGYFSKAGAITGPVLTNSTVQAGPTAPVNVNISIKNLSINGNRTGGHGGSLDHFDAAGNWLPCIGMFGVNGLTIENVAIYESPAFNIWLSNVQNFDIRRVNLTCASPTTNNNQDGVHMNGYVSFGICTNLSGNLNDDFNALNADDGFFTASDPTFGLQQPGATAGPINDILLDANQTSQGISSIRLLSYTQRIDRIRIRAASGLVQGFALHLSRGYDLGLGNIGLVEVDAMQTTIDYLSTSFLLTSNSVQISTNVECLRLNGFEIQNYTYVSTPTSPIVIQRDPGLTNSVFVNQMSINGLDIRESSNYPWNEIIQIAQLCYVQQLNINGVNWYIPYNNATDSLVDGAGTLLNLNVSAFVGPNRIVGGTLVPYTVTGDAFAVPPQINTYTLGTTVGGTITVTGRGMSTVGAVTINGVVASFTVASDQSLSVIAPTTSSGAMVISNVYGKTTRYVNIAGFVDTFNRSNRALAGDNGWVLQQGTNTFNIVSDILNCGTPATSNDTITNTGVSTASGLVQGLMVYGATGAGMQLVAQCSGGASWNGYICDVTNGAAGLTLAAYHVTGGATFTQIGSTVTVPQGLFVIGTDAVVTMVFNGSGVLTMYVNGLQVAQFTDGGTPITAAGTCGFRVGGTATAANLRYCESFSCGA